MSNEAQPSSPLSPNKLHTFFQWLLSPDQKKTNFLFAPHNTNINNEKLAGPHLHREYNSLARLEIIGNRQPLLSCINNSFKKLFQI